MTASSIQNAPKNLFSACLRRSGPARLAALALVGMATLIGAPKSAAALYRCYGSNLATEWDSVIGSWADVYDSTDIEVCPMQLGPLVQGGASGTSLGGLGWARGVASAGAMAESAGTWIGVIGQGMTRHDVDVRLEGPAGASVALVAECSFALDLDVTAPSSGGSASHGKVTSDCGLANFENGAHEYLGGEFKATAWHGSGPGWGGVTYSQWSSVGTLYQDLDPALDLGCLASEGATAFVACTSTLHRFLAPVPATVGDTLRLGAFAMAQAEDGDQDGGSATPATVDHTASIAIDLPPGFHLSILDTCDAAGENCETVDGNFQPLPACSNGLDDDGDGAVDFVGGDTGCNSPDDPNESNPPRCGLLGLESLMVLIPLARRVRRADRSSARPV